MHFQLDIADVLTAATAITVAIIGIFGKMEVSKAKLKAKSDDERAEYHKREAECSMKMMFAALNCSLVTAKAVHGDKQNGNVEDAIKSAEDARNHYNSFINEVHCEVMSK